MRWLGFRFTIDYDRITEKWFLELWKPHAKKVTITANNTDKAKLETIVDDTVLQYWNIQESKRGF